ncbi:MAG: M4 family metallopeptidase, partial [Thermoanaerobaculia bacterium]
MSYGATVDFSPLVSRIGRDVALRIRPGVGTPMEIKGTRLHPAAAVTGNMDRSVATAQQFLQQNRHILRLRNPAEELRLVSQTKDSLGLRHLKFDQHYRGLPVWPAQLIVHLDEAGDVYLLNGAYVPTPRRLLTQPAISAERAAKLSRDLFEGATRAYVSKAELVVYAPDDRAARLAWRLDIDVTFEARWTVLIDAQTGVKLTAISRVQEANVLGSGKDLFGVTRPLNVWGEGGSFFMVDTSKPMYNSASAPPNPETTQGGIFVFDVKNAEFPPAFYVNSSNVNSWSPRDAVSAAFWLSQTHDYFLNRHNRNSLDGQGGSILGFVRLRQNFRNAFWDGQAMFFGDGLPFAGSQDVVGHELTHGVTSNSADLVYQGQSGALNEAFSDIFGEMVEAFALGSNDWLIGSKLPQPFRSMIDPEIFGDPGRMSKFVQTTEDNGGVHTNSGIINRAYYLLAAGLPGAIGASDAERIFYRALTIHLSKNSQFLDARLACMQAAEELFGAGSAQALKVAEAFDAVEVFDTTQPPPPPNIPPVAAADSTLFLYVEGGILKLGRRETAQGDPSQGVELAAGLDFVRPSITGDGALAVYVNTSSDACFIASVGGTPSCLGADGLVHSVAMSPDGSVFSFVLLDGAGNPDNRIKVVDLATDTERDFVLLAPVLDGTSQNTVIAADVMDFTASGRYLIYDAFNLLTLNDGSEIGAWSIYAIDFATNQVLMIVPPIPGLDIGFPAIAQASDNRATFEATDVESGETAVLAEDLSSGTIKTIALVADAITVPSYTGDDSAIVFGVPSAT